MGVFHPYGSLSCLLDVIFHAEYFFSFLSVFSFICNVVFRLVCSGGVSIVCFFFTIIVPRDIPNKCATIYLYAPYLLSMFSNAFFLVSQLSCILSRNLDRAKYVSYSYIINRTRSIPPTSTEITTQKAFWYRPSTCNSLQKTYCHSRLASPWEK